MNPGNSPGRIQFAEQDGTFVLKFIGEVRLIEKRGGKSGHWRAAD